MIEVIYMQIEINIIKFIQQFANTFWDIVMELFSFLGEQYIIVAIIGFIYFIYDKNKGELLIYSIFTSALVNNATKGIFKRTRPFQVDNTIIGKRAQTATGYSFPSGHTQNATTFYGILSTFFKSKKVKFLFYLLIFLIGLSRIYLGVHFPTDVLAGIILGVFCNMFCLTIFDSYFNDEKKRNFVYIITIILFMPFIFVFYKKTYQNILPFRDFYISYAMFIGFWFASVLEHKYVNFSTNTTLKKRWLRFLITMLSFVTIMLSLKLLFPKTNIFFDFLRYFLTVFLSIGILPLIFKKTLFKD